MFSHAIGAQGGGWSVCTHLRLYGLMMDRGLAEGMAAIFQHEGVESAVELGAGLGLYASYLSRSVPRIRDMVAIEPISMALPVPIANLKGSSPLVRQLELDVTSASASQLAAERLDRAQSYTHPPCAPPRTWRTTKLAYVLFMPL